eukprot:11305381-Karenia_brevis.AAC.2
MSSSSMPTPPELPGSSEDVKEIIVDLRKIFKQYLSAAVRQEELLKLLLDAQSDFRDDWAAVASQQKAMLIQLFDHQAFSPRQE